MRCKTCGLTLSWGALPDHTPEHDVDFQIPETKDEFDVDLHTLSTHQALAEEREALIAGLVAFVFGGDETWEANIDGRLINNPNYRRYKS